MGATLVRPPIEAPEVNLSRGDDWRAIEEAYIADLAAWARKVTPGKIVGEVVRWQRADGYASYMVVSERPLRLMHLDLGDGYMVEASLLRGLTLQDVQGMVDWDRSWRESIDESNAVYLTLKPGRVVHYDNGFGQFVRCEVVAASSQKWHKLDAIGGVALKPIALVGNWRDYDLPQRRADGSVYRSYHVRQILDGELFQPNGGNLYESPLYHGRGGVDPRTLEPLSLEPPPATDEEKRFEPLAKKINRIRELVEMRAETEESLRSILAMIHDTSEVE